MAKKLASPLKEKIIFLSNSSLWKWNPVSEFKVFIIFVLLWGFTAMVGLSVGEKHFIHGGIAQDLRSDGRKRLTYRPIYVETGVIPQVWNLVLIAFNPINSISACIWIFIEGYCDRHMVRLELGLVQLMLLPVSRYFFIKCWIFSPCFLLVFDVW